MKKIIDLTEAIFAVRVVTILALAFAVVASPQPAYAFIYGPICRVDVDAIGTQDGSTWANAFISLQTALGHSDCTEIRVAEGVYKPTSSPNYFNINPGVAVYGGFDGTTEGGVTGRDPATHVTILSGDIDDNDINTDLNNIDETYTDIQGTNSNHVVQIYALTTSATSTTVLDGFTVTGGRMPDFSTYGGGGLICMGDTSTGTVHECSPTLANLTFSGNQAEAGGAIYNFGAGSAFGHGTSSPTLTNVTFRGNRASAPGDAAQGGAMYNNGHYGTSSPTLTNVTFQGNSSTDPGGAMYNNAISGFSSPTLTNVTFSGNSAGMGGSGGGAIYNDGSSGGTSEPIMNNVILWGDTAYAGPEIFNWNATSIISYSVIQGGCAATGSTCGAGNLSTDPKLGALANNGGSTQTMALLAGSSAIDKGTNTGCPATDQRGIARPKDGDGNGTATCDIGAYELTRPILASTPASWNYNVVKVGTTSGGKTFTIKNTGSGNLVIGTITLAGTNPAQFHMTANTCSGHTLIHYGTCTITATFGPTSAGAKSANINIPDNAWGQPHKIQLSGKGGTEQSLNSGFNTYAGTTKVPTNWTAANFATTDGKDTVMKKEGTASVRIANTSAHTKTLMQTRMVSGGTGSTFLLSLWEKGKLIPTTAGVVQAQVMLYGGSTLLQTKTITFANGSYDFTRKSITFTATHAYNKIVIKLIYSKGTGTVWFDALSLLRSP